jgi:hypothetical protein
MRRSRLCAALTLCGLLAFASTAAAECTWVLWSSLASSGGGGTGWDIIQAVESRPTCETFVAQKLQSLAKTGADVSGGLVTLKNDDGKTSVLRFLCLPDTIDPRAPKGR